MTLRRMSIRATAAMLKLPAETVKVAAKSGALRSVKTITTTGRERYYISVEDAEEWFAALEAAAPEKERAQA